MSINYKALTEEMPHKWKVQTANDYNCVCVAYVDSRQVQDKLDDVVGPENWTDEYMEVDKQLFCRIGIKTDNGWVYKTDCGTESMTEKEKGQVSDAFKRAAVKWGVGRFLYSKEIKKVKSMKDNRNKNVPADDHGKRIWDLTKHINSMPGGYRPAAKTTEHKPTPGRYNSEKGGANVTYTKVTYSEDTISKVKALEKDGKKGSDVLKDFLTKYNEAKKTSFKLVSELTEVQLKDLVKFVEDTPPTDL